MKKGRKFVFVIIGPPGSGKGTQGKLIAEKYNLHYFVTGDLVRELRVLDTPLGRKVRDNYDKGIPQLDKIIIQAVRQKVSNLNFKNKNGILFDTFPLSVVQAEALEKLVKEFSLPQPFTIYLEIKPATVVKRISTRLVCSKCGAIYLPDNSKSYLKRECAKCGGKLIQRPDDKPRAVIRRIKEYKSRMKDLRNFYYGRGRLIVIDGEPSISKVTSDIFDRINEFEGGKVRNFIILGFSGSGKGTQAELLARKFDMDIVDGGEYLRKLTKSNTPLGRRARKIQRGNLAPTDIVRNWLKKQILARRQKGLIISGQPRMIDEAKLVLKWFREKGYGLPLTIFLRVSEREIRRRLKKRYICADCEKIYVLEKYKADMRCNSCGGKLIKRADDTPKGIKNRLDYFHKQVKKTLTYFKKQGILVEINGEQSIENVFKDILKAVEK